MKNDLKALLTNVTLPGLESVTLLGCLEHQGPEEAAPHPGIIVGAVRRARGLSLDDLGDATGYRRRAKTLEHLERLEQEGAPPTPSSTPGPRPYGTSWKQLVERVLEALEIPDLWLTDVSDRIATVAATGTRTERAPSIHLMGDTWRHVAHAPLPSAVEVDERTLLGEALGFLLENRARVEREPALFFVRPAEALYVMNPPPPDPWPGVDRVVPAPEPALERPLHLGLLLSLWSQGRLVVSDPWEDDPLLVVRCVGHQRLGDVVVSGIHRRSRRWGHHLLRGGLERILPPALRALIHENTRDETPLLWDRHRLRMAYDLIRDRYRRQREGNPQNDLARDIPLWMGPWLGQGLISDVSHQWEQMVRALESACLVPLTDPQWETGFPRLRWIEGCGEDRWRRWLKGRAQGWSDAMLRQRAQGSFQERLTEDIQQHVVAPTLAEALLSMRAGR